MLKKKPPAKKQWKAVPSKPSAISAKKNKSFKRADVAAILKGLKKMYPDAHCELVHRNPFELLVATVLSAQCTDVMVNRVTPGLFQKFPTPQKLAAGDPAEIEDAVGSLNLFRTKAKNIRSLANSLIEKHNGEVPRSLDELVELAGVGRKTANVVLGNAFGIASGIVVDTHVGRLSRRFGWTKSEDAVKIEQELRPLIPESHWVQFSHELIFHGRRVCFARKPLCGVCPLLGDCPQIGVDEVGVPKPGSV